MFIDILGPDHRALASGVSNSTGYIASALCTYAAAVVEVRVAFTTVLLAVVIGLLAGLFWLEETAHFVTKEATMSSFAADGRQDEDESGASITAFHSEPNNRGSRDFTPSFGQVFTTTSWHNRSMGIICLCGLVTNLVTSLTWGLVTIWGKQQSLPNMHLANTSSVFTFAKAFSQIIFGRVSDRYRRKVVLISGFSVTVVGLVLTAMAGRSGSLSVIYIYLLAGGLVTGCGIGSVYCVMTGAISDHAGSAQRASAIGVYKLWRDAGYAVGGLLTGAVADRSGGSLTATALVVAALVAVLVALVAVLYREARFQGARPIVTPVRGGNSVRASNGDERWQELQPVI